MNRLERELKVFTANLLKQWELPAGTSTLEFRKDLDLYHPTVLGTTSSWLRFRRNKGNFTKNWSVETTWKIHLKLLREYVDPLAVGQEAIKHELAHVFANIQRAEWALQFEGKEQIIYAFMQVDPKIDYPEYIAGHGTAWAEWCAKIGANPSPSIDREQHPLISLSVTQQI